MVPDASPLLFSDIVRGFTTVACLVGIVLCLVIVVLRLRGPAAGTDIRVAHIELPNVALLKILALIALFCLPLLAIGGGTYATLEDTKKVSQCGSCHPMKLFVNDMRDPNSETLAAQHFKNRWIQEEQCYHCHTDYGFQGTISAKIRGVGHLTYYLTETYSEPIELRHGFKNSNCLYCHGGTPKYEAEEMHTSTAEEIASDEASCITCHDSPHPSKEERSPGHPVYERLMKAAS
jgi:hypothetical protein